MIRSLHTRQQGVSQRRFALYWRTAAWSSLVLLLSAPTTQAENTPPGDRAIAAQREQAQEFFEKQVRPLLLAECADCHGSKKQWSGLRVDSRDALLKGGESGPAIEPGDPDASLLISAVRREGLEMPPKKTLSAQQVAILETWIRDGAHWPKHLAGGTNSGDAAKTHWAFQPVRSLTPPAMDDTWCRTDIDRFVLSRLRAAGLNPAAEADRRTLIRRVTYDLTGLPPTEAEVDAFETDTSPEAYERLIDRLLESPRHGEHWARHWLDVARYSDSKGYVYAREERFFVHAPLYRDWVIRAFNEDLPYDRFLLLQLAADQVAPDDPEQLAAMGFLTLGRRFLGVTHDIIDDRIDVVTRGTMGLTVACARCHDHKYDPIPTSDYYSLYGVFQNCTQRMTCITQQPLEEVTPADFLEELRKRQSALETALQENRKDVAGRARDRVGDYLEAQTRLNDFPEEGFDQILTKHDLFPAFVRRWADYLAATERTSDPVFIAWRRFAGLPADEFAAGSAAVSAQLTQNEPPTVNPLVAELFTTPPESMSDVASRYGGLFTAIHKEWQERRAANSDGKQGSSAARLDDPAREQIRQVLYGSGSPCMVPDEEIITIEQYFDSDTTTKLWKLQGEVDRWLMSSEQAPDYAMAVLDRKLLREPRIFRRGNPANKGEQIPRQFLSVVAQAPRKPFEQGSGRLELAEAIIDPANPLTARVWVNRVWMHHFGEGLVRTPSDFGLRADPPSHPDLLDWLTSWFIDHGWSTKELHRLILRSSVYRQSSVLPDDPVALQKAELTDPENRLLWRMNLHRLTFEEMRDTLLAVSGHLDFTMGGRGVSLADESNHRRTVYCRVDRQFLPGVLRVFDFANPDLHIPQRSQTTVPQQALFGMNHPLIAHRAKALAIHTKDLDAAQRVQSLYRRILQRDPTESERQASIGFVAAAEASPPPTVRPETLAWKYGYASIEPETGQLGEFHQLPYFTGSAWQGGVAWPDSKLGWVQLTADGGHPGNTLQHAAVRRWVAPTACQISIASTVKNEPEAGDGIRCWIISNRQGVLAQTEVHHGEKPFAVEKLSVEVGETLDFVVDIKKVLNSDQYIWSPIIRQATAENATFGAATPSAWDSQRDFTGPTNVYLKPWEQLAQVLLLSNELMFVD